MRSFWQDIRYAARTLRNAPGFTILAVVTLGLGMAVNTTVFTVVNGLVRPLAVPHPEQIVVMEMTQDGTEGYQGFSYPDFQDIARQAGATAEIFAYSSTLARIVADGKMDRGLVSIVSNNYFSTLGIRPALGGLISTENGQTNPDPIIVLGYSYWQKRFGADTGVIGKQVQINGRALRIIGVTPKGFQGAFAFVDMLGYVPYGSTIGPRSATSREDRAYSVLGRLKPGVSLKQAQAPLSVVAGRLAADHPEIDKGIHIQAYPERLARPEPDPENTLPLMAAAFTTLGGLVLLVASFNIANIFLVRATARRREMGIRAALGAGRGQLVRQHLAESVTLALFGGAAGLLLATWAGRSMSAMSVGTDTFLTFDFQPDARVYSFAFLAVIVTALVVGLLPALRVARADINSVLREGGRTSGTRSHGRIRNVLVGAQIAGSLLLLVVAGLFMRSLSSARRLDLGFNPDHVLNVTLDAEEFGLNGVRSREFYRQLGERIAALPGVTATAQAFTTPLRLVTAEKPVTVEGRVIEPGTQPPQIMYNAVSPGYFATLQIQLLKGRDFTAADNEKFVAVINQAMADRFWPNENPVGKRFSDHGLKGPFMEVIGVTPTGQYEELFEPPKPFYYVPIEQNSGGFRIIHVRTSRPPEALQHEIEAQVHALAPGAAVPQMQTMMEALRGVNGFLFYEFAAELTAVNALLGLALALVGVYSMASYAVAQRTHEIGIRMALGAEPRDISIMVLRQNVVTVGVGLTVGLAAALAGTRAIAALISGIRPTDPLTFISVIVLLSATSLLACGAPARRASRMDPLIALRYD